MRIARFEKDAGAKVGVVIGDEVAELGVDDSIDLIENWGDHLKIIQRGVSEGKRHRLTSIQLLPPVNRPGKIFAIGLNYADHIQESNQPTPTNQVWFTKAVTSINSPYGAIEIARECKAVDYEVELVAVIGRRGRYISKEDAPNYVFGYCVGNDVTERLWQHRTPQWSLGKSFDTHAPIGPWITTIDEVPDPHALGLRCSVNGESRQDSNTKYLVFSIWDQVAHLSHAMTLEPGDLIFSGTPGGVGGAMKPPQFLKPGDVVRCEIDGLGHIEGMMKQSA